MICTPGAARSIAAFAFEKPTARSSGPTAAAVSTCGSEAGNSGGLPSCPSLPAAATGTTPALTANCTATYSS